MLLKSLAGFQEFEAYLKSFRPKEFQQSALTPTYSNCTKTHQTLLNLRIPHQYFLNTYCSSYENLKRSLE